jgi:TolB-like protein
VLAAFGVWWWRSPGREAPAIAVLPFQNLSSDAEQGFFADGVTIEILSSLSRINGLRVIGRTSSFRVPDSSRNPRDAAALPGVRYVLTGSVQRSGDELRIAAQLYDIRNGEQLWAITFDRPFTDILAVQEEIATAVASALQIRLGVGELSRQIGMTRNVAAYDEYVRGLAANLEWREAAFPEAIARLRRAVTLDPEFSLAWSELAIVSGNAAVAFPERAAEWRDIGAEAIARARLLAHDQPPVLLAQAIDELRRGEWHAAAATYARLDAAYRKSGQHDEAAGPRGIFLLATGHAREAIQDLERARAHDPLAPAFAGFLGQAHLVAGNFEAALAEADRGLSLQGLDELLHRLALRTAMNMRDVGEIRRRISALDEPAPDALNAAMAVFLDRPADAGAAIRERAATADADTRLLLAEWAAYYREPELAMELLVQAQPNLARPGLLWEPLMSEVRALAGFRDLLEKSGIVGYWRATRWPEFCRPAQGNEFSCS